MLSKMVKKVKNIGKPECHHFDKTFKAHTEWVGERPSYYGNQPETRKLYFKCDDCGEILTRVQRKDFNGDLISYKHITEEDMPY